MNDANTAENALRAHLGAYKDPYIGQTLAELKALGPITVSQGAATAQITLASRAPTTRPSCWRACAPEWRVNWQTYR